MTGTSPRLPSASTSSPWSRAIAATCSSASQPGAPSRSKQASCGLTATQAGPAATIAARQWSVTASAVCARARRAAPGSPPDPRHGLRPQRCRVGVEPEHDTTAALLNERRKPVGEMRRRAPGSQGLTRRRRVLRAALDCALQRGAGAEARHPAGGDLDLLAGLRVHALTGAAVGDRELPEAGEVDLSTARTALPDACQERRRRPWPPHPSQARLSVRDRSTNSFFVTTFLLAGGN